MSEWIEEDSENGEVESSAAKALRWLDELVVNVHLTDDQVIEVAKVYMLQDLVAALRARV